MTYLRKLIFFTMVLLSVLTINIINSYSATHYVGNGENYETIQGAINSASDDDVIIVKDGVYFENVNIYQKTLTLKSEHGYTNTTIISENSNQNIINLSRSKEVVIDGFTLYGTKYNDNYIYSAISLYNSDCCIIRNNRFGIDEDHYNQCALNFDSDSCYTIVSDNIFMSNTDKAIWLKGYYNIITGNIFNGSEYAICLESGYNSISQNSFINQKNNSIKRLTADNSSFCTPFEIVYKWKGQSHKNHIGNYYSDQISKDDNGDGIIDGYYDLPNTQSDDDYPLVSPASEYKTQILFLQKDMLLTNTIDSNSQATVDFNKQTSLIWISDTTFEKTVSYSDKDAWSGNLTFYNQHSVSGLINIEIGYTTDGTVFNSLASKVIKIKNSVYSSSFFFEKQTLTFSAGSYLAFKITNLSNNNYQIRTANFGSYLSPPLSYTRPPTIYSIEPDNGICNGGTKVTINGISFGYDKGNVYFDDQPAPVCSSWSYTQLECYTPRNEQGFSTIRIERSDKVNGYSYKKFLYKDNILFVGQNEDFQNIQDAINHADEGDLIIVKPGIYRENIYITKSVYLKSQGGADSTSIVADERLIDILANKTQIQGFKLYNENDSSTCVYIRGNYCIINENKFGFNSEKLNNIGIYINSNDNNIIMNNKFSYFKTAIKIEGNNSKIIGNTISSSICGLKLNSNNTIYYNNFIDNELNIESGETYINSWNSPIFINYIKEETAYINYIGNYYDNHILSDKDQDGITDSFHILPYLEQEDQFPLAQPIENYQIQFFTLNKDMSIETNSNIKIGDDVEFSYGKMLLWSMSNDNNLNFHLFENRYINGYLLFNKSLGNGVKFEICAGFTTNGQDFFKKGTVNIIGDGEKNGFNYAMNIDAFSLKDNERFAIRIKNYSGGVYNLITGGNNSFFSITSKYPDLHVLNVSPTYGATNGTSVTIKGIGFGEIQGNTKIFFGSEPVTTYTSWTNDTIVCHTPAHQHGWADISLERDGFVNNIQRVKFLYHDKILYVGESQMFSSIQQAINHAQDEYKIIVKSGQYKENIYVNKPITLQSENNYTFTTISPANTYDYIVKIDHKNCIVDGFTFEDYTTNAILVNTNKGNCIIRNNRCGINNEQKGRFGINIQSSYNIIENNILSYNDDYGIFISQSNNKIIYNTCIKNKTGIQLSSHFNSTLYNTCNNNSEYGIYIGSRNNNVSYNSCNNNNYSGIKMTNHRNIIHKNKCISNGNSGIYNENQSESNIISSNFCETNNSYGIYIKSSDNYIYLNQFQYNGDDITKNVYSSWHNTSKWYIPFPIYYNYNNKLIFNYIGNYYNGMYSSDANHDGVFEDSYLIPINYSESDPYPLAASTENYEPNLLFMHPDGVLTQIDTIDIESKNIYSNQSILFITTSDIASSIDFTNPHTWSGQIMTDSPLYKNEELSINLGYIDTNENFIALGLPVTLTGDGNNYYYFTFQGETQSTTSTINNKLAIKIDNPNSSDEQILTGGRWSFISIGDTNEAVPVAKDDEYSVSIGGTLIIETPGILENDINPDNNSQLTAILKDNPSHGSLLLKSNGGFTYVHDGSSISSDKFTYIVNNGSSDSFIIAAVKINILTSPTISIIPKEGITNNLITVTIAANNNTIEYNLNNSEWQKYTQPLEISEQGKHTIIARLQTQDQNWINSETKTFIIDKTPPETPEFINSTPMVNVNTDSTSITINWKDAGDNLTDVIGYSFELNSQEDFIPDQSLDTTGLSAIINDLEPGNYYFHISAIDKANNISNPLHIGTYIITSGNPPPTPTNLKIIEQKNGRVKLTWDYINDYNNLTYHVYRSEMPDGRYYRIETGLSGFSSINNEIVYYTDSGLDYEKTYYYKVKSYQNEQESLDFSNRVEASPKNDFNFSCSVTDYDTTNFGRISKAVNIGSSVKYFFQVQDLEKFNGELEVSCKDIPNHVSYSFDLNGKEYGASLNNVDLPAAITLRISVGSAAESGEYKFKLLFQNIWADGSSDFLEIPLFLTILNRYKSGIIVNINKQPEASIYEARFLKSNKDSINLFTQKTQIISEDNLTYKIYQYDSFEIYGEIIPKQINKIVTLKLIDSQNIVISKQVYTNKNGQFNDNNLLSELKQGKYTLIGQWQDENSGVYESRPRTIIVEKGKPMLTCVSKLQSVPDINEDFTIRGRLIPSIPGEYISLNIISPDGYTNFYNCLLDEAGEYEITNTFFNKKGIWKIKAYWFGNDSTIGCESDFLMIPVKVEVGRAMILGGGEALLENLLFAATKKLTLDAYRDFRARGFKDNMIYYSINSQIVDYNHDDISDPIVDNTKPSVDNFLNAIENEFASELNETIPLFIYMIGHGTDDGRFKVLGNDEMLHANDLSQSFNIIQSKTNCPIILILESCYSGKFIPYLSGTNRIILTSAGDERYLIDSKGDISFSRNLFKMIRENFSFKTAFDITAGEMNKIGYPKPLLDDDGNGISDSNDGKIAVNQYLRGDISLNLIVDIDDIKMEHIVQNGLLTFVSVNVIRGDNETDEVWANIIPPNIDNTDDHEIITYKKTILSYNSFSKRYEGFLNYMYKAGLYKIVFFARQKDGLVSLPKVEYLTVEHDVNIPDINLDKKVTIADMIQALQILSDLSQNETSYNVRIFDIILGLQILSDF